MCQATDATRENPTTVWNEHFVESSSSSDESDQEMLSNNNDDDRWSWRRRARRIRVCRLTPFRALTVLFLIATYTTLFLPDPDLLPPMTAMPHYSSTTTIATTRTATTAQHAAAFARTEVQPELTYQARTRFYQQDAIQGFWIFPWYWTVGVLACLLCWAVSEQRRSGQSVCD